MRNIPAFVLSFISLFATACGVAPAATDVSDGEVTSVDGIDDLDGNGVEDYGNQSYAFGQSPVGASVGFMFSETLPANGEGVSMALFGYGSEDYSSAEYGWETAFLPLFEMTDSSGFVVGYGATALRDGLYEVNCGLTDAKPHEKDGWCDALAGFNAEFDDVSFLSPIINGSPDCVGVSGYDESGYRQDVNWAFMVQSGVIMPSGGSFAPPDTNCYPED